MTICDAQDQDSLIWLSRQAIVIYTQMKNELKREIMNLKYFCKSLDGNPVIKHLINSNPIENPKTQTKSFLLTFWISKNTGITLK